jgi:hypothetical protein
MPSDNLFHKVDKHFVHLIENKPHPPIIALIMRRSTGIQVLECHVFICRSTNEAQAIVNEIKTACNKHKQEMSQKTQIFQYKPYSSESGSVSSSTSQSINLKLKQQESSQPVELPLRIQDKVETKTTLTNVNDGTKHSLPPKSPFFKTGKKGPAQMTTEKVYETSYIDGGTTNTLNKSACIVQTNGTRGSNANIAQNLATKSSSHISAKGPASASSASLFSKIKSNLRDRSLSKSNTNLSSSEFQPQQAAPIFVNQRSKDQDSTSGHSDMNGNNSSMSKSQRKNTFKQIKSKKAEGKESLPLSSTSSITFGSKINDSIGHNNSVNKARPVSSLSNNDCDSQDDSPSPAFVKKIDKTSLKMQQQQYQHSKIHPQSILVNGGRKEPSAAAVNVFYDEDTVSVKSDSCVTATPSKIVPDNKKETKKVSFYNSFFIQFL